MAPAQHQIIKNKAQTAVINILNLHILIKTWRFVISICYHCFLRLIFDQTTMAQEQKYLRCALSLHKC